MMGTAVHGKTESEMSRGGRGMEFWRLTAEVSMEWL